MDTRFDLSRFTVIFAASALWAMAPNQVSAQIAAYPAYQPQHQVMTPQPVQNYAAYGQNPYNSASYGANTHYAGPFAQPVASQAGVGRYGYTPKTNHSSGSQPNQELINGHPQTFWEKLTGKNKQYYANRSDLWRGARLPQYQIRPTIPQNPLDQFQRWSNVEPEYTLYPGDQIDIVVSSAPELSRTLTVGPDGRVVMPMADPVMAAGRTMSAVQTDLSSQLGKQLRDPRIAITPRAYGPQQIYIGGEVAVQGTYTLPGPIGVMEAVLMAGGFQTSARTRQVVVLRRAPNGGFMARTINFQDGLQNIHSLADNVQMKRGDIIFIPRSDIAEVGLFMQSIRGVLPFDLGISYNLGDSFNN